MKWIPTLFTFTIFEKNPAFNSFHDDFYFTPGMIQGPARTERSTPRSYHPSRDSCYFELETNWSSITLADKLLPKKL